MNPDLLPLLGFLAGALAVVGIYSVLSDLFLRDRSRFSRRVDEEFRRRQREQARKAGLFKDLATLAAEAAGDEDQASLRQRFVALVDQSGLDLDPRRLLALMGGCALALGALAFLAQGPVSGGLAALVGAALPLLYVHRKRSARLEKLLVQMPDALELMARIIRAGQTMSQALQAVTDEFDQPIAGEFNYCYEQQNLGLPPEAAFRDLARRAGLLEVKIFVLALLVQQQTGGNLAELLDKLAVVIRERFRIRGKIRALTAEGRMQALVLLCLPPGLLLVLTLINPGYSRVLFQNSAILLVTLVSELLGALWIRKIVNFDF